MNSNAGHVPLYAEPPADNPMGIIAHLRRENEALRVANLTMTHDYAAQRPDGEILGIFSTRHEAEAETRRVAGRAHVVERLSSPWSKPLT